MSLVTFIGPRPNLLDLEGTSKQKRLEAAHPILTNENLERIRGIGDVADNQFRTVTLDITYARRPRRRRHGQGARHALQARRSRRARRREHHHPVGPRDGARPDSDPVAAGDERRASSSDPLRLAHLGRPRGRDRRGARGASIRDACRLRRRSDQSLSRLRDHRGHAARDRRGADGRRSGQALHQGDRQGHAQGDVQDGHLHLSVLLRRADLRRGRLAVATSSPNISPAPTARSRASGSRRSRARRSSATASPSPMRLCCARRSRSAANMPTAFAARRICGARRWSPICSMPCAASCPRNTGPTPSDQRADRAASDLARHVPHQDRRGDGPQARSARSRSSRPRTSSSASRPAPCRSARSAARRIPRSPSP